MVLPDQEPLAFAEKLQQRHLNLGSLIPHTTATSAPFHDGKKHFIAIVICCLTYFVRKIFADSLIKKQGVQ